MKKFFNIGTLNRQGCKDKKKQVSIAKDAEKYKLQILGITETHVATQEIQEIKGSKESYNIYHNGIEGNNSFSGVGVIIEKVIKANFTRISDRILSKSN